ncbi:MAG: hypothetical protein IJS47_02550 [Clostridia bacterium]|nr:hypothetical protein [Clostridia bacterium]
MKSIKKIAGRWYDGLVLLILGDTTSYFTYITLLLCEIHILCIYFDVSISKLLIFITLCHIVNLIVGAILKSKSTTASDDIICCAAIGAMFFVLAILSIVAAKSSILFITIPLIYTAITNIVRKLNLKLLENEDAIFRYYFVTILDKIIRLAIPFALFVFFTAMWGLPIWFDISLTIIFVLIMPFTALLENLISKDDLFELPFHINYDNEE